MSEDMDVLRAKLGETEALARELFEQQFIRCGGRMPADPEWDDLEQVERDDWWDRALDARPLIERERSSRQAWATEALRLESQRDKLLEALREQLTEWRSVKDQSPEFVGRTAGAAEALILAQWVFTAQEGPLDSSASICACPSDEQAADLVAAGFSRPQCAVHTNTGGEA